MHQRLILGPGRRLYFGVLLIAFFFLLITLIVWGVWQDPWIEIREWVGLVLVLAVSSLALRSCVPRGLPESHNSFHAGILLFAISILVTPLITRVGIARGFVPSIEVPSISQMLKLSEHIYLETGWDYSRARRRMFFLNIHEENSIRLIYEDVVAREKNIRGTDKNPSGYFVAMGQDLNRNNFSEWILKREPLHPNLRQALLAGDIILGEPRSFSRLWAIPYWVRPGAFLPQEIQNGGDAYEKSPGEELLSDGLGGGKLLPDQSILFQWNECENVGCQIGRAHV